MENKIILKSIALIDWKAQNKEINFNTEGSTKISGRNGSGKSTIIKAWNWLLTGNTDPYSNRNSELYDNKSELSVHTPLAIVRAVLNIDGYDYKLERRARCAFTRRRGSGEYEKAKSDEYTILIDDIEINATNFKAWIEAHIAPESALVFCLDGNYFCTLALEDKAKARRVLEGIVGEIRREDFRGDYSSIDEELSRGFSAEEIIERNRKALQPLKSRISEIETLKNANKATVEEYSLIDYDEIEAKIDDYHKQIRDIDNTILGNGDAIKPILDKRDAIFSVINTKSLALNDAKGKYLAAYNEKVRDIKARKSGIESHNREIERGKDALRANIERSKRDISYCQSVIEECIATRERLLKERDEVKAMTFSADKCPMCGAPLAEDVLERKLATFNEEKQTRLSAIIAKGKANNAKKEELESQVASLKASIEEIERELENYESPLSTEDFDKEMKALEASFVPFEETEEYLALSAEIAALKDSLPIIPSNDNDALTTLKSNILSEVSKLTKELGKRDIVDRCKEKDAEYDKEMEDIIISIARIEGKIDAALAYIQEKADIVSFRINDRLTGCKVDMYSRQKDGSLVGDCVITDSRGVKYSTINNSARMRIAIEMQKLFMRHFNISLPIFVDESSVFDSASLPKGEGNQMIYLFASDSDLKVE